MSRLYLQALSASITVVGVITGASIWANYTKGQSTQQAMNAAADAQTEAREWAHKSNNGGATLVFSTSGGRVVGWIYDGRPDPKEVMSATAVAGPFEFPRGTTVSAPGIAGGPPFSIVIASDYESAVAAWAPGGGVLAAEPTCPAGGTEQLVFSNGTTQSRATLVCQTGMVQ